MQYNSSRIAQFAPYCISDEVIALKVKVLTEKKVTAARKELNAELVKELKKMRSMSPEDQEVLLLKTTAIEEALFMHCPNPACNIPFDDFTACFAITCSACQAQFCAWCFHHMFSTSSGEIHAHVRQCPQTRGEKGSTFGNRKLLDEYWNELRVQKLRELVKGKSKAVKRKLLVALKSDLNNRGIHLDTL